MTARIARRLALGLLAIGLCQCQAKETGSPETTFDIDLNIAPDTLKTLQAAGDKVTVDVYYFGPATPEHQKDADEEGRIRLGDDLFDVKPGVRTLKVTGAGIDRSLLGQVVNREPHVMVWAYSTDTVGQNTQRISCDYAFAAIRDARTRPVKVTCGPYRP